MQKTGLRKGAESTEKDRQYPKVGAMATSVGLPLGKRIPWSAHHSTGVNVHDAMKGSTALGVRKVDFAERYVSASEAGDHRRRRPNMQGENPTLFPVVCVSVTLADIVYTLSM